MTRCQHYSAARRRSGRLPVSFSLRQQGTSHYHELRSRPRLERILPSAARYFTSSVYGFSAQSAEKPYTDKRKYRAAEGKNSRPCKSCHYVQQEIFVR